MYLQVKNVFSSWYANIVVSLSFFVISVIDTLLLISNHLSKGQSWTTDLLSMVQQARVDTLFLHQATSCE